jgi:hypothetical protein
MSSAMQSSRNAALDCEDEPARAMAWGPSAAGAIGGFGATIWLATLGTALGLSAGAAMADNGATSDDARAFGAGAVGWLLVSAIVVGIVGGGLLAWTGRDRNFRPVPWAVVTWAAGVTLAVVVASLGSTGMMSAVGAATGTRGAEAVRASEAGFAPGSTTPSPADRAASEQAIQAADDAAEAGAAVAWTTAIAQFVGLLATVLAARAFHRRFTNDRIENRGTTTSAPHVPNPA